MRKVSLTYEQQEFIRENHTRMTGIEMAKFLHLSKYCVYNWARNNGCQTPKEFLISVRAEKNSLKTSSTPEIDQMIIDNYLKIPVKALAISIGKSAMFVKTRIRKLGLIIPRSIIDQRIISTRFQPGCTPHNKGKKMDPDLREKVKHTFFSKNRMPKNTLYDGAIIIRKYHRDRLQYKYIRISAGVWDSLQRHVWMKEYGAIPEGMIVTFKDGDTLNCELSNLELISRADNAIRNKLKDYPEDIVKTIQARSLLNRTIKKITENEQK